MYEPMPMKDRVELCQDVITDLIRNIDIAAHTGLDHHDITKNPFRAIRMTWYNYKCKRIRKDLVEYHSWLTEADAEADWTDAHELICELNDQLAIYKPTLIVVFEIPARDTKVTAEEFYLAITYGGSL